MVFAYKRPIIVDFLGFFIFLAFVVVMYVYYLTPSMQISDGGPNLSMSMFAIFYLISCQYMSSNFLRTFILRQILTWASLSLQIWMQYKEHKLQVGMIFGLTFIVVLLPEGSNYYSIRSKAQLFLRLKVTSMQER